MASPELSISYRIARRLARPALGPLQQRIDQLADQVAEATRTANLAAGNSTNALAQVDHALALAEAAHRAVEAGDPIATRELVVTTRDEVRRLMVDLTEQLNALSSTVRASASTR